MQKKVHQREMCQTPTENQNTETSEENKPQVEALIMCSYLPCNSLAAASEGTLPLYAELF